MNKKKFKRISLATVAVAIFLFSSCKKDINENVKTLPAAGLMAFNLIPDNGAVGFAISGNPLTSAPLLYGNYTGTYRGVYVGSRDVASYNFNSGTTFFTSTQLFEDSAYYSVFAIGANGSYRNIIVKDNLDSLPTTTGQAFLRYINAIADSTGLPLVNVTSNGTNVFSNTAAFGTVSAFKGVTPGNISISVNNETAVNASRTITVEQGKIYTVLISGIPGESDSTKAVQIRYIQNGTVTTNP